MRTIAQRLVLFDLPPGLNMVISDVQLRLPEDGRDWAVEFACDNGQSVSVNAYRDLPSHNSLQLPITVPLWVSEYSQIQGNIGVVKLGGYDGGMCISGRGGSVDISIRIRGSVNVDGTSYTIDETAFISVSATNWKGLSRPDYTNVSYTRGNGAPTTMSVRVPKLMEPDVMCFSCHVGAAGQLEVVFNHVGSFALRHVLQIA